MPQRDAAVPTNEIGSTDNKNDSPKPSKTFLADGLKKDSPKSDESFVQTLKLLTPTNNKNASTEETDDITIDLDEPTDSGQPVRKTQSREYVETFYRLMYSPNANSLPLSELRKYGAKIEAEFNSKNDQEDSLPPTIIWTPPVP